MKQNVNTIKIGHVIEHKSRLWRVVKTMHVKPGKGGAFVQMELKDVENGTKSLERFRSEETLERAHVEERSFQYLYRNGTTFNLMDNESYEQIALEETLLDTNAAPFLEDNMHVQISMIDGKPISINLPSTVVAEVSEAEAVVKGQTASGSYKPAKLWNGVRIMVPPYIEAGEKIIVDVIEHTFVERAKKGFSSSGRPQ